MQMGRVIAAGRSAPGANTESAELIDSDKVRSPESGTLVLIGYSSQLDSTVKLLVGGESVVDNMTVHQWITPGMLKYPDDMIVSTKVRKGDALSLKVRCVTAANVDYRLMIL